MIIRPETSADFPAIRKVVTKAFESQAEADLVDRIRTGSEYRPDMALVAVEADQIVGHVMIDGCWVRGEHVDREIVMLSPLAVLPSHQQHGIGSTLIKAALDAADEAGEPLVALEGSPTFYGNRGFVFAGDHGLALPIPDWAPREAAQVYLLSGYDRQDTSLRGTVVYPPSFDGLG